MALKETIEGYSVIAFVPVDRYRDAGSALAEAETLRADIRKHCELGRSDIIDIEPQVSRECEYCGYSWTEKSKTYNGGCCDADAEAEEQRKADAVANGQFGVGA